MTPSASVSQISAARRAQAARGQLEHHLLAFITLGLVAFGIVMVYSASSARATLASGDSAIYLKRQGAFAVVGIILLTVLSRTDFRLLRRCGGPLLGVSLVFLLGVLAIGNVVNGARRWLELGPLVFQPSELIKLALALWVAALLARRPPPATLGELMRPIGLVGGVSCLLVLVQPDLGTVITIAVMLGAVLLVAGTPVRILVGAGSLGLALFLAAAWFEPYRRARLLTFLDPFRDPDGPGYQAVQAQIALGSGGLFGTGLGESVQKAYYLPEASTDMIFAIVGEELGLLGATAVILAFVLIGYAGFRIALHCRDPFGKRLATGLTALVCGQAALNLCAVMGLAPLTGIPLPFVSYGGSSLVVGLASVGILLNIAVSHAGDSRASLPDRRRRHGGSRPARARGGGGPERARRRGELRRLA